MKTLVFAALVVSILLVFTVGTALAAPPVGNPPPSWAEAGDNIWKTHDGADSGMEWGVAVSNNFSNRP